MDLLNGGDKTARHNLEKYTDGVTALGKKNTPENKRRLSFLGQTGVEGGLKKPDHRGAKLFHGLMTPHSNPVREDWLNNFHKIFEVNTLVFEERAKRLGTIGDVPPSSGAVSGLPPKREGGAESVYMINDKLEAVECRTVADVSAARAAGFKELPQGEPWHVWCSRDI